MFLGFSKVSKGFKRFQRFTRDTYLVLCVSRVRVLPSWQGHCDLDAQIGKSRQPTTGWDSQPRASGRKASLVQMVQYSRNNALWVWTIQCIICDLEILCSLGAQPSLLMRQGSNLWRIQSRKRGGRIHCTASVSPKLHRTFCVCTDVLVYQVLHDVQHSATVVLTVLCTHSSTQL